jgi:hypothetical protein
MAQYVAPRSLEYMTASAAAAYCRLDARKIERELIPDAILRSGNGKPYTLFLVSTLDDYADEHADEQAKRAARKAKVAA